MSRTNRDIRKLKRRKLVEKWLEDWSPNRPITPYPGDDYYNWMSSYPHWWDTMHHHAPARRFNRDKLTKILKEENEDDGNWRDHKKPHKYYW